MLNLRSITLIVTSLFMFTALVSLIPMFPATAYAAKSSHSVKSKSCLGYKRSTILAMDSDQLLNLLIKCAGEEQEAGYRNDQYSFSAIGRQMDFIASVNPAPVSSATGGSTLRPNHCSASELQSGCVDSWQPLGRMLWPYCQCH